MRFLWSDLDESELGACRSVAQFLTGRLEERASVDWALQLKTKDKVQRLAVLSLLHRPEPGPLREPWSTAWNLIEESWGSNPEDHHSPDPYDASHQLQRGVRSGALVKLIVECVAPRLKVKAYSDREFLTRPLPKRPKRVEDLLSVSLVSGKVVDPSILSIKNIDEKYFLISLAHDLEAAVIHGLDIARRLAWEGAGQQWRLGSLHRVCYVEPGQRGGEEHEPDEFHEGIAPSVKLLCSVVERLSGIDKATCNEFLNKWKYSSLPIFTRLWASLSKDTGITSIEDVRKFLFLIDNEKFWNITNYPEIAELRAIRFKELTLQDQTSLANRIIRQSPRNLWPRKASPDRIDELRLYSALREARRIELAGGTLPATAKSWLDANIVTHAELLEVERVDFGFPHLSKAQWVPANPDNRFDLLSGEERLRELNAALDSPRSGWNDDPATRASDWIRQITSPALIILDFEATPESGSAYPKVWEAFGWAHKPASADNRVEAQTEERAQSERVLSLLGRLRVEAIRQSIDGISHWLTAWETYFVDSHAIWDIWFKIWPIASESTNLQQALDEEVNLSLRVQSTGPREPMDLDTLNTPAGKLVGVFLALCPNLENHPLPFAAGSPLRKMRDEISAAVGRSGLIALYRMIEELAYFLHADPDWTQNTLIAPLTLDTANAIPLWRGFARRARSRQVIAAVGELMAVRANDVRLGRNSRSYLVQALVVECLHSYYEKRASVVPRERMTQMLRSLDDEVRVSGAEYVHRYVRDISAVKGEGEVAPSPEDLFFLAALPFLQEVWPQERSLASPGVSKALAELPAASKGAFPEAVSAIERFLVPTDCWSLLDYGLHGNDEEGAVIKIVNSPKMAEALLRLLDLTIGTSETSVIPYDLGDALDQVIKVAPKLGETRVFRRLATAARRTR